MASLESTLTQQRLKELLHYDPETGVLTWIVSRKGRFIRAGQIAYGRNNGYVIICVDGRLYRGHRLAWLYMTGGFPADQIDHINRVRDDNKWSNLREVNNKTNAENTSSARTSNRIGILGVSVRGNSFRAKITTNGKPICLGTYKNKEDARNAYIVAKRKYHEGCTI